MKIDLEKIITEGRNQNSEKIDRVNTNEMLKIINDEDKKVAIAVEKVLPEIAEAVDIIYGQLLKGGRLVYCGAGTSGRLGVLDAAECPPTYSVEPELVVALIAGGERAFIKAVEGAEDDFTLGEKDLRQINFSSEDVLVGIAASGRTPYAIGALKYAKSIGAPTVSVTCNPYSEMAEITRVSIAPITGPEVVTGSTRMKSGTAQKMILNMISTAVMIKLGKVYGNLMVDVKATNQKLIERTKNIVCAATGADKDTAVKALEKSEFSAKPAILMILGNVDYNEAMDILKRCDGRIAEAISMAKKD